MALRKLAVLAGLAVVVIDASLAGPAWIVREDGAGPVRIGMSLSQLNGVLHEKFLMPVETDEQACFYVNPSGRPQIGFMILEGRLARIDVRSPGVRTAAGIQVGDSEARALRVYGRKLKVEPHAYTGEAGGHYLTLRSSNGRYGIRFETYHGEIIEFYAGRFDAIQYIEGCL